MCSLTLYVFLCMRCVVCSAKPNSPNGKKTTYKIFGFCVLAIVECMRVIGEFHHAAKNRYDVTVVFAYECVRVCVVARFFMLSLCSSFSWTYTQFFSTLKYTNDNIFIWVVDYIRQFSILLVFFSLFRFFFCSVRYLVLSLLSFSTNCAAECCFFCR